MGLSFFLYVGRGKIVSTHSLIPLVEISGDPYKIPITTGNTLKSFKNT